MTHVEALTCGVCGREFSPGEVTYTCPAHDGVGGSLDVRYEYDALARAFDVPGTVEDLWAFAPLLPVDGEPVVSLGAGGTPLLDAPALSADLGVSMRVKDETGNPTGSSKDRGSAVAVTRARQRGRSVVSCASTGNAAASLAGYAARAGLDCRIFVPADLPEAKAVQPRVYGAEVLAVEGDYEDASRVCHATATERGWYDCSAGVNPYLFEGKRTLGFELARDAADADWVAMAMGNGCSLAATWKGMAELDRLGLSDGTARFLGVQAEGASAIHDRFTDEWGDGAGETAADSIDVAAPHSAKRACCALADSGGDAVLVNDDAILRAQRRLGEHEGLFVEPASAATVAGVERALAAGVIDPADEVVVVATGTGLKDTRTAGRAAEGGRRVDVDSDPDTVPEF